MMQIIGLSICGLLLTILLRDYNKTISVVVMLATAAVIFFLIADGVSEVFGFISKISNGADSAAEYIKLMMKVLGITLIAQFTSDICRDAGENTLASQTETAAKIIVILMVLPLFETVLNIITGLLE